MIFKELCNEWLTTWCEGLAYLTQRSYNTYCEHLKQMFDLVNIGDTDVADLKPYHIQKVLNALSCEWSSSTVVKYKAILHCIFKCAVRWEILNKNIVDCCVLPKGSGSDYEDTDEVKNYWTADEANTFVYWLLHDGCPYRPTEQEIMYIILALATGARRGELVALTTDDIGYNYIRINKSSYRAGEGQQKNKKPKSKHSKRTVTVSPKIIDNLEGMMERRNRQNGWITPYVFTQRSRPNQMSVDSPSHFFKRICKYAPVPTITLHGLRHTHASILIEDGLDVAAVSKRLGHSKTSTTLNIYTHSGEIADNNAASSISRILGL